METTDKLRASLRRTWAFSESDTRCNSISSSIHKV